MCVEEVAVVATLLVILGEVLVLWIALIFHKDKLVLPALVVLLLTASAAFFLPHFI